MGGIFNSNDPDRSDYKPVDIDNDLKSRYLGVLDKYLTEKGMVDYIPREGRPYELRSEAERGDMRQASGNQVTPQGTIQKPTLNDGLSFPEQAQPAERNPNLKNNAISEAPATERQVSSQMMPASVTAPRQNQIPLTSNTAFFQEDERRKQEEFNKVKDYVYRDQRSR